MKFNQKQVQQQEVEREADTDNLIYSDELRIREYANQILRIREYYVEHGWTKPNTSELRCLYNNSPQFRNMCDDDPDVRHVLWCLFHDEQPAWDAHYKAFLHHAESRLQREPTEQESRTSPTWVSVSLAFLLEFWNDAYCAHQHLAMLKDWLSNLYQNSDDATQQRLETEVLPILFDVQEIAIFFRDWEENPNLQDVYTKVMQAPREQVPFYDESGEVQRSYRQALNNIRGYVLSHASIHMKRAEEKDRTNGEK